MPFKLAPLVRLFLYYKFLFCLSYAKSFLLLQKKKKMETEKDIQKLKAELAASKKEVKSLNNKLERSKSKIERQKAELKKKEIETIELTDEQLQSLSNRLPGIDIKSLLSD